MRHPAGHGAACAILDWLVAALQTCVWSGGCSGTSSRPAWQHSALRTLRCGTVGAMPAPCCSVGATAAVRILAQAAAAACQAAQNLGPITITAPSAACHI